MKVLITSGGTREYIDDVRVLTNVSSGALGSLIASRFAEDGHKVTYVAPIGAMHPDPGRLNVSNLIATNTDSVMEAMKELVPKTDAVIMAMAVSDFAFDLDSSIKVSSNSPEAFIQHMQKTIRKTPKIISHLREWNQKAVLVGFKFTVGKSTKELHAIAASLKINNRLDMVFANDKTKMTRADLHVGQLLMDDWEEQLFGKQEIADTIYTNVVRLHGMKQHV